ncbi:M56 family metallopeptidase [Pseudoxanthomonas sp. UTMC 1351]|uniref:M56 family metallopeptidase n=1 Tax=Pseudoxanthomonas sp. UTMC 1351 TaxID=2695853 RepID=UPI0034CFB479
MIGHWTQALLTLGAQHLWQSLLLLVFAVLVSGMDKLSAGVRSWMLLGAFALAAASPLAILLPGDERPLIDVSFAQSAAAEAGAPGLVRANATTPQGETLSQEVAVNGLSIGSPAVLKFLALIWFVGTLWSLTRMLMGWYQARRLRGSASRALELERLMGSELPHNAAIAFSDAAVGPMVIGLVRPCILVPPELAKSLTPAAMADLLLHEIAHIRRRDLWLSAAQRLVLSLYWWSPFLRIIGRRLDLMREMACDERAALRSGGGRAYAGSLLVGVSKLLTPPDRDALLAVGVFGHRSDLARRVDSLLSMEGKAARRGVHAAWVVLCAMALVAHVGITLAATPRLGRNTMSAPSSASTETGTSSAQAEQLIAAASAGRLDEVRQLVRRGVDVDSQVDGEGTALIGAARHGQSVMVDELLALGAQPDRHVWGDGNPLIAAARSGHLDIVERLVAAGADVNRVVTYDETPLINASRSGHLPVVTYLVEQGADVNLGVVADRGRWRSPLNQARNPRVWNYLVQHGAVAGKP